MRKTALFGFLFVLVFSGLTFAIASTPTLKPVFESNSMIDFTFSKGSAYTLPADNLDNKLYFFTPAKDVSIHYFEGGNEMRAVLHNIGRIDVWPKFSFMQFDSDSQGPTMVLKDKRTTAQAPVRFRAVFYEGKQTPASQPYVAPPITTPIEPAVPGTPPGNASCDFVYGAKDNAGEITGFKLSGNGSAGEFKSVVFGQEEKVDYTYLYSSTDGAAKKVNVKKIELLTSTKDSASKTVSGNSVDYSFSSPVLVLVTPENGKQFVAAVRKITFSSKAGVQNALQFEAPDLGNFNLTVASGSLAIKSRDKPFSIDLTPQQKVSSLSWGSSGASCYPAYVEGRDKPVWIRDFTFETVPTYAGSRLGSAKGCESQAGHCVTDAGVNFFTFNFPAKSNVTLVSCSVLADNLEVSQGKLGEVTLETVAIFGEQPKVVFDGKKVEFQYSLKQGDEKTFGINNALWNVVYDPSSFDYYYERNAQGGVPSSVPRHDDAAYSPKYHFCPARDKNSLAVYNSGDYIARLWIAGTGKNVVLEEKLVRLVNPGESFGQFLLAYRSSSVVQKNFEFKTNYADAQNSPKGILFNNVLYSIFSIAPASSSLAASFLASARETATGKFVLDVVNPPAFGAVGKISLKNFFFTGSRISFSTKADKFEGVAFTVLQPKSVGAPVAVCDSSLYNPATSAKKCLDAAPFCWGAYLGKYRCYPSAALNGFAAVDAYACKGIAIKSSDGKVSEYGTAYLSYAQGKGYCSTGVRAKQLQAQGVCKATSEKISYAITKGGKMENHDVSVWDCSKLASDSSGAGTTPSKVKAAGSSACHDDDEECKQREAAAKTTGARANTTSSTGVNPPSGAQAASFSKMIFYQRTNLDDSMLEKFKKLGFDTVILPVFLQQNPNSPPNRPWSGNKDTSPSVVAARVEKINSKGLNVVLWINTVESNYKLVQDARNAGIPLYKTASSEFEKVCVIDSGASAFLYDFYSRELESLRKWLDARDVKVNGFLLNYEGTLHGACSTDKAKFAEASEEALNAVSKSIKEQFGSGVNLFVDGNALDENCLTLNQGLDYKRLQAKYSLTPLLKLLFKTELDDFVSSKKTCVQGRPFYVGLSFLEVELQPVANSLQKPPQICDYWRKLSKISGFQGVGIFEWVGFNQALYRSNFGLKNVFACS